MTATACFVACIPSQVPALSGSGRIGGQIGAEGVHALTNQAVATKCIEMALVMAITIIEI